jgi:hypothetical protein
MGTALTDDERVQQLRELVEEYVKYLDLWDKVSVEKLIKTEANLPSMVKVRDNYGIEKEELRYETVKTAPSPYVKVLYHSPKGKWKDILHPSGFESREFPMCDIVRRITHYKNRLKNLKEKSE